jgi:hypothetical protein
MREYIVCLVFWLIFTILLHGLGKSLCKEKKSTSFYFVTGYLVYSFIVAVAGIIIQILNLPWNTFAYFMAAVWVAVLAVLVISRRKTGRISWKDVLREYIKDNWVMLTVCMFLCGMLFFYYNAFWYGNHLDDGYYITKVATMPYNATGFRTNYSVGILNKNIDSYVFNTWELEASFYVKMLNVKATLFLRLFQSTFNYFLFLNCLKLLAEQMFAKAGRKAGLKGAQFVTVIGTLFGGFYLYLMDTNLFFVRDMFHVNSAMFYGGTIVKLLSIVLLLVFLVDIDEIDMKTIITIAVVSVVLISKSSIALPLIIIAAFAYLEVSLLFNYKKRGRNIALLLSLVYVAVAIFIPGNNGAQSEVYQYVRLAVKSPVMIVCTAIFIFSFFWKNKVIIRLNSVLLICMGLMVLPQINDIFEVFSVYVFVAGRAWGTWAYTYVMLNIIYLYMLLCYCLKNANITKMLYVVLGLVLIVTDLTGFNKYGGELFTTEQPVEADVKYNFRVFLGNPYFTPGSTIELGCVLEKLAKEKAEELRVVMPEGVSMNRTVHNLAVQVRTFAPDITVPSAINRYRVEKGSELEGYSQEYYDKFAADPSYTTGDSLKRELEKYQVNCVVVQNVECGSFLKDMGYHLYQKINEEEYYIWSK